MSKPSEAELRAVYDECNGVVVRVAERMGKPLNTVKHWYRQLGLGGKGRGGPSKLMPPRGELEAAYARFGGNLQVIAEHFGRSRTAVHSWLREMGLQGKGRAAYQSAYPGKIAVSIRDGYAICFSDAHFWFEEKSRAHEALLVACKKLKPVAVIANGDLLDGASISRHPPSGIDPVPGLADELEVTKCHMAEIARATPNAQRYFTLGNHDARFSRYLAQHAPELEGVDGSRLDHHILGWQFCMSVALNDDVIVKHRFRGGVHATRNNTLNDGRTIVCGHLHSQKVTPVTDARGTRYGVDLGCLADPNWPQFAYTEENTKDWRSGFGVVEFKSGRLLPPMLASVMDDGSVYMQKNERLL